MYSDLVLSGSRTEPDFFTVNGEYFSYISRLIDKQLEADTSAFLGTMSDEHGLEIEQLENFLQESGYNDQD
jgi:hypothetical protein